ncbi:hypothetical protein EGJ28_15920 [Stutzerimonas xanthomarina]|uniref:Uncharacterized protein n=1 Tax=Stutzerimonas xanthomarina TaxID=271420 RepID=A0A3R8VD10_9GAMM|nr:hypothetical protein [Stutzerimonas xanthomarina]RRV08759.1 hypothetical protein EGJ28_15920 [Stutzerimonas xanthomarina]
MKAYFNNQCVRESIYRLSNLIAFAIAASLLIWLSPGAELLREAGLNDDLIRMSMLAVAIIPALVGGLLIRIIVESPEQTAASSSGQ